MPRLLLLLITCSSITAYSQVLRHNLVIKKNVVANVSDNIFKKTPVASLLLQPVVTFVESPVTNCAGNPSCEPLSLTSLLLQAKRFTIETVRLNWKTLNEIDTRGFDIERSFDNTDRFLKIGFHNSAVNNLQEKKYIFNDNNNYEGTTFYRLKQLDADGNFTYSNIVAVNGVSKNESLRVYPNPADNFIWIEVVIKKNSHCSLTFFDAAGKQVMQQSKIFIKGVNTAPVDISSFASGIYTLRVTRLQESDMVIKFIKY